MPIMVGQSIGRYRIDSHLADGGMSTLWNAYDPLLKRTVALKILKQDLLLHSKDFVPMFEQEAALMASLEHPHILPVYDFGYYGDVPYCILRIIANNTLNSLLEKGGMSLKAVIQFVEQLASAIDYCHQRGIAHRDLKPQNILLSEQNHPYLTDFGLAFIPDSFKHLHSGSPFYMAPEQWQNSSSDGQADLFALGLMIFQCFTGHYPIPEGFDPASAPKIKAYRTDPGRKQLPSVRTYVPHLPMGVDVVLDRLTRFDPQERYTSAREAAEALSHTFISGQSQIEGKVFISYSRHDSDYVYKLAKQLADVGVDLWIDQNLVPGSDWDSGIEKELNTCQKMLVVLSPAAVASRNVQDEWSYFLEKGREVYPLLYQECDVPFRLRRRQYIQATGDVFGDVSRIIDALAGGVPTALTGSIPEVSSVPPPSLPERDAETSMSEVQFLTTSTQAAFETYSEVIADLEERSRKGEREYTADDNGVLRPIDEILAELKSKRDRGASSE